ncbi:MAG: hypothetical protein WDA06_00860 [Phenylobacterium sp.]
MITICEDCKFVKMKLERLTLRQIYFCKKNIASIDFVTGLRLYSRCDILNQNGQCKDFEPSFFAKICNKKYRKKKS